MKSSLVYLASPYSHPDPAVQEARFHEVCKAASHLMRAGLHVFSPIAHTHPIALAGSLPKDWEYWKAYDEAVLASCRALVVLKLDGWEESKAVRGEVEIAGERGLTTYRVRPAPLDLDRVAYLLLHELPLQPDERTLGRLEFAREIAKHLLKVSQPLTAQWVLDLAEGVEPINPEVAAKTPPTSPLERR